MSIYLGDIFCQKCDMMGFLRLLTLHERKTFFRSCKRFCALPCKSVEFFTCRPPCFLQFSAHDRGERVLDRPHAERHRAHGLRRRPTSYLCRWTPALDALCRQENARAVRYQCTHGLFHVRRDAAAAERLDDDARKAVQDREERRRKVGREPQHEHMRLEALHEARRSFCGRGRVQITFPSATRPAGGSLAETNASSAVECTLRTFVPRRMRRAARHTRRAVHPPPRAAHRADFPARPSPPRPSAASSRVTMTGRSICGRR